MLDTGLALQKMHKAIITGWMEPRQISFTGEQTMILEWLILVYKFRIEIPKEQL